VWKKHTEKIEEEEGGKEEEERGEEGGARPSRHGEQQRCIVSRFSRFNESFVIIGVK